MDMFKMGYGYVLLFVMKQDKTHGSLYLIKGNLINLDEVVQALKLIYILN